MDPIENITVLGIIKPIENLQLATLSELVGREKNLRENEGSRERERWATQWLLFCRHTFFRRRN